MKCPSQTEIDLSMIEFPGKQKEIETWELCLKIGVVILLELMALIGNVLVIMIVLQSKKMRTTTNLYIVNLAIADLFMASFPMWIVVVDDVTNTWVLGEFLCKFNAFLQVTAMCASTFTLLVIAGDRFFAIIYPLNARVTQRKVSVMVIGIWLSAIAVGSAPLFTYTYKERTWKNYVEKFCTDVWPTYTIKEKCDNGLTSKRAFWTMVSVVLNWVPMIVMTILYTIIILNLRFNRVVPSSGELSLSAIQRRSKSKVVKMLFSVLIVFMICTVPFQITKLYELYREEQSERLPMWYTPFYFTSIILMYTNTAVNPILYGGFNENFRNGFKDLINRVLRRQGSHGISLMNGTGRPRPSIVEELRIRPYAASSGRRMSSLYC
ncbi:trissin receptor-like [Patella vulgata]|uniref:trissin receptor-like n=1 Tax=Patella vulgata TaxID=6465 RepID=UPI00217F3694|nr:trissin receptor-like [Patella vulgata]